MLPIFCIIDVLVTDSIFLYCIEYVNFEFELQSSLSLFYGKRSNSGGMRERMRVKEIPAWSSDSDMSDAILSQAAERDVSMFW